MSAKGSFGKAIDWDHISKVVVTEAGKRQLQALRNAYEDVATTINDTFNMKPPIIDWEFYRSKIGPSLVSMFEQADASLEREIPNYEDEFTPEYKQKLQSMLKKATEQENASKKKIIMLGREIESIQEQKEALSTQTVDDYFAKNPALREKIDDEIRNHNWDPKVSTTVS
ncbi:hypothetical protein BDL97_08G031400 [Sphagnum fallax]|nr:hypothetical protein BDL97_08G031400 [Sphagnum fallax]